MTVIGLRVLCLFVALSAAAALLATDTLPVPTFNSSAYVSGAGGYQQVIYEDSMYNTTVTNMVWTRIHLEPCGMDLPQIHEGLSELTYIVSGTVVGAVITPGDNTGGFSTFQTGDVLAVSAGALHYAENPTAMSHWSFCRPFQAGIAVSTLTS